jgi:trehalose 6-phosphate phosphatase
MRDILARANRGVLRDFASSRVLVAFDYDGTLAPIVADPARAAMRARTRALLGRVARLYPVIVVSGRARADVEQRVAGVPLGEVVGNHGLEPWHGGRRAAGAVRRWLPVLAHGLAGLRGVVVEDKIFSVAVHYRRARAKPQARAAILAASAALDDARLIGGRQVVNLVPRGAPHKGLAVERLRARCSCDSALYVGDDETDEDVFALARAGRLLAIRVGARRGSAAAYFVKSQRAVDALLRVLIDERSPTGRPRRP